MISAPVERVFSLTGLLSKDEIQAGRNADVFMLYSPLQYHDLTELKFVNTADDCQKHIFDDAFDNDDPDDDNH